VLILLLDQRIIIRLERMNTKNSIEKYFPFPEQMGSRVNNALPHPW